MGLLRDAPIKRKLTAIIVVTASVVLLISLLVSLATQARFAREATVSHLQAMAAVMGTSASTLMLLSDHKAAQALLATLATQQDVVKAELVTLEGTVFAVYPPLADDDVANYPHADTTDLPFYQASVVYPINVGNDLVGTFHLIGDMSRMRDILLLQGVASLVVFAVSILLAVVMSQRLQRVVSVPVRRLIQVMEQVAKTRDFGRRVRRHGDDEFGRLTDVFNNMLDRLQQYDEQVGAHSSELEAQVQLRTEELEKARGRAEAASRAKGDFLAMMSHEIRTPMTGVIGFARLLEHTELNDKQRGYLRTIDQSAHSLLDIIDQILDFSKLEVGRTELEMRDFSVNELLQHVQDTLLPKALDKHIAFVISRAPSLPRRLHGDAGRLRQILLNVVGNALKFTDAGRVQVTVDYSPLQLRGGLLQIVVKDTGIGISAAQQAMLFKPFHQGDGTITRRFGGTGLGLVISQRLARLMNGDIAVCSEPGEGSVFTITVAVDRAGPGLQGHDASKAVESRGDAMPGEGAACDDLNGVRVLVVDDSAINLRLAVSLLSRCGIDVAAHSSGADAVAAARDERFDLILMDLEMPGVSGIEATARIRSAGAGLASIPIVAVTAHASAEKRQEAMAAGMCDLLAKPYLPESLYAIVRKWHTAQGDPTDASDPCAHLPAYDHSAALASVDGDADVASAMLEEFLNSLSNGQSSLRIVHGAPADAQALREFVHLLAGSAPIVGALALGDRAATLNNMLRQPSPSAAAVVAACAALEREIERLRQQLKSRDSPL